MTVDKVGKLDEDAGSEGRVDVNRSSQLSDPARVPEASKESGAARLGAIIAAALHSCDSDKRLSSSGECTSGGGDDSSTADRDSADSKGVNVDKEDGDEERGEDPLAQDEGLRASAGEGPATDAQTDSRGCSKGKHPRPEVLIPCPRCGSNDTKFCYYNNYNVKQPRYFCKGCQRYWTAGGTLRNVPIGAGRRKTKMSSKESKAGIGFPPGQKAVEGKGDHITSSLPMVGAAAPLGQYAQSIRQMLGDHALSAVYAPGAGAQFPSAANNLATGLTNLHNFPGLLPPLTDIPSQFRNLSNSNLLPGAHQYVQPGSQQPWAQNVDPRLLTGAHLLSGYDSAQVAGGSGPSEDGSVDGRRVRMRPSSPIPSQPTSTTCTLPLLDSRGHQGAPSSVPQTDLPADGPSAEGDSSKGGAKCNADPTLTWLNNFPNSLRPSQSAPMDHVHDAHMGASNLTDWLSLASNNTPQAVAAQAAVAAVQAAAGGSHPAHAAAAHAALQVQAAQAAQAAAAQSAASGWNPSQCWPHVWPYHGGYNVAASYMAAAAAVQAAYGNPSRLTTPGWNPLMDPAAAAVVAAAGNPGAPSGQLSSLSGPSAQVAAASALMAQAVAQQQAAPPLPGLSQQGAAMYSGVGAPTASASFNSWSGNKPLGQAPAPLWPPQLDMTNPGGQGPIHGLGWGGGWPMGLNAHPAPAALPPTNPSLAGGMVGGPLGIGGLPPVGLGAPSLGGSLGPPGGSFTPAQLAGLGLGCLTGGNVGNLLKPLAGAGNGSGMSGASGNSGVTGFLSNHSRSYE